ncbi:MAG: ATP-dependent sacrificial sulfur transferase LarE [Ignavibacteria bacterium]|nr:ATP-dependent sacrificial sulfur transferase LarE [Ignavibacteria bacterium]
MIEQKALSLEKKFENYNKVVVGFSAGVDSTLVSYVANLKLRENAVIVLARTETITDEDISLARTLANEYDFNYLEISYNELSIENYAKNPVDRCYYCKSELYSRLRQIASERNIKYVLDGANLDDTNDYRPGRKSAMEYNVVSPLIECGFTKQDVRELAKYYKIPNHNKPSAPCLSSRVPYGTPIDLATLTKIAQAEKIVKEKGFYNVRVRHYGNKAKVEVDKHDVSRLKSIYNEIKKSFSIVGYSEVEIDPEGFKSGKLNKDLVEQNEKK